MTSSSDRPGRIAFEPALEGLRGFALLGMLCFHSEFSWASGGFLPIPTFFTLSGFLITSLFLVEWERTGQIALGAFWARRFRRLMPAALLTLGLMPLYAVLVATPDQVARLGDAVTWALFYVANWYFMLSEVAYAQLFEAPSPVQHFWSLSIEEQFYLVFPLIMLAGMWIGRGSRVVLAGLLALLTAASVGISVWLTEAGAVSDRIYYGSDARCAELFLGCLLATWLCGRELRSAAVRRGIEILGAVAMLAMLWLWSVVEIDDGWLYRGGFAAYSLLSLAVITAGVQPSGPVRWLLSGRLMCWVGRVSYAAYLFHWPVYLWLSSDRTGLGDVPLFVLRLVVTFGLASLSHRFVESPIRSGRSLTGWRPFVVAPAAFGIVLLGAATLPAETNHELLPDGVTLDDIEAFAEDWVRAEELPVGLPLSTAPPTRSAKRPRIAVFGDSTSIPPSVTLGLWLEKNELGYFRKGHTELGCGIARKGRYQFAGTELERPEHCAIREKDWADDIAMSRPDVVLMLAGPWDVCGRMLPGSDQWQQPGDPEFDAYLLDEMLSIVDLLTVDGALLIWLTHPSIEVRNLDGSRPDVPFAGSDPARMARFNELVFEAARLRPDSVRVIDLAAYMRALPGGEMDARYRPDGTHLNYAGAMRIVHDWLGHEVLRVYRGAADRPASGPLSSGLPSSGRQEADAS